LINEKQVRDVEMDNEKVNGILLFSAFGVIVGLVFTLLVMVLFFSSVINFYQATYTITWLSINGIIVISMYFIVQLIAANFFIKRRSRGRLAIILSCVMGVISVFYFTVLPPIVYKVPLEEVDLLPLFFRLSIWWF
jgi:hypothetical protein